MADQSTPTGTPKPRTIRPRNVSRKSKAEREAYEKQEDQRRAARSAAAAGANASRKPAGGSSKQTDRKTTDNKQKDGQQKPVAGSGVFGAGSRGKTSSLRRPQDAGQSEMLEGQEGVKPEDGVRTAPNGGSSSKNPTDIPSTGTRAGGTSAALGIAEEPAYAIDREVDEEPRRDIEHIWLSSDDDIEPVDEEPVIPSKRKAKAKAARAWKTSLALRPVRAARSAVEEHDEDETAVKRARKHPIPGRMLQQDREEPDADFDDMEIDEEQVQPGHSHIKQDVPSSPELGRRRAGKRAQTRSKDSRTAVETVEERAERLRLRDDIRKMRKEFLIFPKSEDPEATDSDDTDASQPGDEKLLLFQFPPLLPYLVDAKSIQAPNSPVVAIKRDPDAVHSTIPAQHDDPMAVDSAAAPELQSEGMFTATEPLRIPAGRVGKLSIHKSGKISLDWGGIDMELRHGTEVDFLQDVVLLEGPEQDAREDDSGTERPAPSGMAYGLGQVRRKFVAIPDWQKLYD